MSLAQCLMHSWRFINDSYYYELTLRLIFYFLELNAKSRTMSSWFWKVVWFRCVSLSEGQVKQEAAVAHQPSHCLNQ